MANITLKVTEEVLNKMKDFYKEDMVPNNGDYIVFFAKVDDVTITAYSSKKGYKVVFSSENEAKIWDNSVEAAPKKEKTDPDKPSWIYLGEQIGSDEVGTGDFFGPVCVCAAYVTPDDIEFLRSLGVDDSKRLTDERIMELGKILINRIEYSQCSIPNEKYNEVNERGLNMNAIKAKLHNQVLSNLARKHPNARVFMDQFADSSTYYHYLADSADVLYGITFRTKGESYYPSVAVGSIIARYSFLCKMRDLSDKYQMDIPFGASEKVTKFAKKFAEKYGIDELEKIIKKNFKNYKDLSEN